MIHMQAAIDIQASTADVFRLLCDPELKARLNPEIELLHAFTETPGPMQVGSRIQYRLLSNGQPREFLCVVTAYEHHRVIEWKSNTHPAFRVRQTVEPASNGCRLIHDEWLETATPSKVNRPHMSFNDMVQIFQQAAGMDLSAATTLVADPVESTQAAMESSLTRWLENIRAHLEQSQPQTADDFQVISTMAF